MLLFFDIFISGSSSLLQCSNSWCNDDQTTTVDRVRDGVYVTYVCRVPDNSSALKWDVSMSGEIREFNSSDPIATTLVVDDIFFYTVIENGVSLASSLSFNFTDSLNGIVISCTDQSAMTTNTIAVVKQGKANIFIIIIMLWNVNYYYCQRMF